MAPKGDKGKQNKQDISINSTKAALLKYTWRLNVGSARVRHNTAFSSLVLAVYDPFLTERPEKENCWVVEKEHSSRIKNIQGKILIYSSDRSCPSFPPSSFYCLLEAEKKQHTALVHFLIAV